MVHDIDITASVPLPDAYVFDRIGVIHNQEY